MNPIHPIDYRYGSDQMRKIFTRENWLKYFKLVEQNLLEALIETGVIKEKIDLDDLKECMSRVTINDVTRWEKITRHETMAVIKAISEKCGEYSKYLHLGATSNDILDTILALQIKDANKIILNKIEKLIDSLIKLISKHKKTPLLGRTHGRAAIPITYGFRFSLYLDEIFRAYQQIKKASEVVLVGKLGGAVGTQVELYPLMKKIEDIFLTKLGLGKATFYTQVIPRDRLATYLNSLILLSSILEHLANEIRIMQRSGLEEVMEEFGETQVGSSVMPHKKNPIMSERVCGLGRKIRALSSAIYENIILEDERDLRNSSFERTTIPELFLLLDEQINLSIRIVTNLKIYEKTAYKNLENEKPFIFSDLILQMTVKRGGDRQEAHEHLRKIFTEKQPKNINELIKELMKDKYLSKYLSQEDIKDAVSLDKYIDAAANRVEKLLSYITFKDSSNTQ